MMDSNGWKPAGRFLICVRAPYRGACVIPHSDYSYPYRLSVAIVSPLSAYCVPGPSMGA